MSRLQDHLAAELAKKVRSHGLVIWDDPDQVYASAAARLAPDGVPLVTYDGSWFALRRSIEPQLSQPTCPSLVVYVPARPPAQDPLEEVRHAGKAWSLTLRALLGAVLKGELTATRIEQLAKQAKTIAEAEAVLDSGGVIDARLVAAFGTADVAAVAVDVLVGCRDDSMVDLGIRELVAATLTTHFGAPVTSATVEELRGSFFRAATLIALRAAQADLPDAWASASEGPVTASQSARSQQLFEQLRDPRRVATHRRLGEELDRDLAVVDVLPWSPGLVDCDVTPALDEVAFVEAMRLLDQGDHGGAELLAESRLRISRWAQLPAGPEAGAVGPDHPYRRWRALSRIAALQQLVTECRPGPMTSGGGLLAWYANEGWHVDRAQRLVELARVDLGHLAGLDAHVTTARRNYERWLDEVVTATTTAIAANGLEVDGLMRQADVFEQLMTGPSVKTAYVLVDALRLELGHALVERLGRPGGKELPSCRPAIAAAPTITPVGMANVLPGAESGLTITSDGSNIVTSIAGIEVRGVPDRVAAVRRAVGDVLDVDFTDLVGRSDAHLQAEIDKVDVVLVRSTDIDAAGESGRLGTAWRAVDGVLDDLVGQVLRLGRLGVRRVVITADHGFIALSQQLSTGRILERPAASGELHRRCWLGTGGVTPDGAVRIPLAELGVGGGLDLVVPQGLAVFASSGSRQFFHGGLAPQELLVPVIEAMVATPESVPAGKPKVAITVAGKGITTGVFAATLSFAGDLFAREVGVRVIARTSKGTKPIARLVAGDGYDPDSGTVTVSAEPAVLTFQVIANLNKSTSVELHVLDARTGIELVRPVQVGVATTVNVEEDGL